MKNQLLPLGTLIGAGLPFVAHITKCQASPPFALVGS
jgi:hypothetical protein